MPPEILVVRGYDLFSSILVERGFTVINFPVVKTEAVKDLSELDAVLSEIETFDGIFITSPHAAEPFLERFEEKKTAFSGKFYLLGERTSRLFKPFDVRIFDNGGATTAAELLNS